MPTVLTDKARTASNVYIVIVNWNGWADTIECLESVFRLNYPNISVIVCDNGSTDGSLAKIQSWASGALLANCANPALAGLVAPPLPKPIPFVLLSSVGELVCQSAAPLTLIQISGNLGFASGNNVGMSFALSQPNCKYVWLLNNDTVVDPMALSAMVEKMETDSQLGICGSVLREYFAPHSIQTLGGRKYDAWSGRTHPILGVPKGESEAVVCLDYIEGASMLVRQEFLTSVGLMAVDYFLYFEEIDWAMRARGRFTLGFARQSIVYHKGGQSTGSGPDRKARSAISDRYASRNRLMFTARYHPRLLPSVLFFVGGAAIHAFLRGRFENAIAILRGAMEAFIGWGLY